MALFAQFTNTSYDFLVVDQTENGNEIGEEYTGCLGIFKYRDGKRQTDSMEMYADNDATLHIKPTEPFITALGGQLVGNGVRVAKNGQNALEYRIEQVVEGYDFDTGQLEFYKLVLLRESFASWQPPLE